MPKPVKRARKKKTATAQWSTRVYTGWRSNSPRYMVVRPADSKLSRALLSKRSTALEVCTGIGAILFRRFRLRPTWAGGHVVGKHAEQSEQGKRAEHRLE